MEDDRATPKLQKTLVHFLNFANKILETQRRFQNHLVIEVEESPKEYTSYVFKFDFGTQKYETFVLVYWDIDEFDEVKLIAEIDELEMMAEKVQAG